MSEHEMSVPRTQGGLEPPKLVDSLVGFGPSIVSQVYPWLLAKSALQDAVIAHYAPPPLEPRLREEWNRVLFGMLDSGRGKFWGRLDHRVLEDARDARLMAAAHDARSEEIGRALQGRLASLFAGARGKGRSRAAQRRRAARESVLRFVVTTTLWEDA